MMLHALRTLQQGTRKRPDPPTDDPPDDPSDDLSDDPPPGDGHSTRSEEGSRATTPQ